MASNSFGEILRFTTFGESHGPAVGVVIDGCPAGLSLQESDILEKLEMRKGGRNLFVTERKEEDVPQILSGVFEGQTTGAPIAILIHNRDVKTAHYEPIKDYLRPGHANFSYLEKYGVFDWRGGGRASARETVCRVAAGAVASKILEQAGITVVSYLKEAGGISIKESFQTQEIHHLRMKTQESSIFCPDIALESAIKTAILTAKEEDDSVGGIIETVVHPMPSGLGDPVYQKIEARLAFGMLSLPACKGFEIGSGFESASMRGSVHNDAFILNAGRVETETNHAGGVLGGITTGMPLVFRVAFKPPSSIKRKMQTVTVDRKEAMMEYPETSRHDPCVAIRAVPVVEAMTLFTIADLILLSRCSKV